KDEERRCAKRAPGADDRLLGRVVGKLALRGLCAEQHQPARPLGEEPDPGVAAGQGVGVRGETARDLVELEGRREVAAELEERVLTAWGGHLTLPIGETGPGLERTAGDDV